jgi:hypothetical protein
MDFRVILVSFRTQFQRRHRLILVGRTWTPQSTLTSGLLSEFLHGLVARVAPAIGQALPAVPDESGLLRVTVAAVRFVPGLQQPKNFPTLRFHIRPFDASLYFHFDFHLNRQTLNHLTPILFT